MPNPNTIVNKILGKRITIDKKTKNRVKLPGVKSKIGTAMGDADYIGTEIEDANGRWNDSYQIRDGYWVIHEGKKHHVYKNY